MTLKKCLFILAFMLIAGILASVYSIPIIRAIGLTMIGMIAIFTVFMIIMGIINQSKDTGKIAKLWLIKKGRHRDLWMSLRNIRIYLLKKDFVLNKTYQLTNSCWWKDEDMQVNKLVGLGFGLNHHFDSLRAGWFPFGSKQDKRFQLLVYYYYRGERFEEYMMVVPAEAMINVQIKRIGGVYRLFITSYDEERNRYTKTFDYSPSKDYEFGYLLHPYIGGTNPAVQDNLIYEN